MAPPSPSPSCSVTNSPKKPKTPLAQEATNPPPETGTAGSTNTSDPHTQGVKGLNQAPLVELVRLYSNPDVRDIVVHAAKAVTHVKLDHYSAASFFRLADTGGSSTDWASRSSASC